MAEQPYNLLVLYRAGTGIGRWGLLFIVIVVVVIIIVIVIISSSNGGSGRD